MQKKIAKDIWVVAISILFFLFWKFTTLEFRFGDENVYFYMSQAVLDGFVPHKDFFLADPPLFIYLLAIYKSIIGEHLILFKALPAILDSVSAIFIFLLLRKNNSFAWLGPIIYLFSFTVLSTSDYVTGAEMMILFMLIALYLDQKEKYFYSGIFWAFACLVKLYAGPALLGFMAYKIITKEYQPIKKIILGGLSATAVIMVPFMIMAPNQTLYNLFIHQFNRPIGINKWNVFGVFVLYQWLILLSGIVAMFIIKKKSWIYSFIFSLIFFLWYRDLYYLYLHILIPFLVLLTIELINYLNKKQKELAWTFLFLLSVTSIYGVVAYENTFQPQGIFNNPEEIAQTLKAEPDNLPVYGAQETAPLLALMSEKSIFKNIIDTNTQNFASGTHNLETISNEALRSGIYLVARTGYYPELGIENTGFEKYFTKSLAESSCKLIKNFERISPRDPLNQVSIYKCQERNHSQ